MMLSLGLFVFEVNTAAYQSLARQIAWRWQQHERIGLRPMQQYLGKGEDTITLNGTLMPELTGGQSNLEMISDMADNGKAYALLDGKGHIIGIFIITGLSQNHSEFFQGGTARKIDFTINLKRIDDNAVDRLGDLSGYVENLIAK